MARTHLAIVVAAGLAVALVAGAFVAPVYRFETVSESGRVTSGTDTLVGVNGPASALVAAIPLLTVVAVGICLRRRWRVPAWIVTGLLFAFTLLAMLSIGIFVLPIAVLLVVACAGTSQQRPAVQK